MVPFASLLCTLATHVRIYFQLWRYASWGAAFLSILLDNNALYRPFSGLYTPLPTVSPLNDAFLFHPLSYTYSLPSLSLLWLLQQPYSRRYPLPVHFLSFDIYLLPALTAACLFAATRCIGFLCLRSDSLPCPFIDGYFASLLCYCHYPLC